MTACSLAETKDCADCSPKTIGTGVQPDRKSVIELKDALSAPIAMAATAPLVIAKAAVGRAPAEETRLDSKESFQDVYCHRYQMAQDTVDVEALLEKANEGPRKESFVEFWTSHSCRAPSKNDMNVPVIYNTVNNPVKNEIFPKTIHDFLIEERNDPDTWMKMINTPTDQGFTFLDFIKYNEDRNNYKLKETQEASNRIMLYVCKNGGNYSKYKDSAKCP
jgi:hypothetical protein